MRHSNILMKKKNRHLRTYLSFWAPRAGYSKLTVSVHLVTIPPCVRIAGKVFESYTNSIQYCSLRSNRKIPFGGFLLLQQHHGLISILSDKEYMQNTWRNLCFIKELIKTDDVQEVA